MTTILNEDQPEVLAYLEDGLFESLDDEQALAWPERFLSAIQAGADLSGVWPAWAQWMLADPVHGVIRYASERDDVREAIERVAALYRDGGTSEQFLAVERAAVAATATSAMASRSAAAAAWAATAAWSAAWASEAARAAEGARAAAMRAGWAARAAAAAAWTLAAGPGAWEVRSSADVASTAWTLAACDELVRLLEAAPIAQQ